ncbi:MULTISPECIES: hypothetical protein [unclassified Microcoleus]|uniref:hypothetical protein n=1 Tax=unclassified Microcoleus TaxID=2642155 RepID=UPI002FD18749
MCNISVVCLKLDLKVSDRFVPTVTFLSTNSTYQPQRGDRPCGCSDSSLRVLMASFVTVTAISRARISPIKPGYSGLRQNAEINYNQVDRDGLGVAQPEKDTRSGRYS